MFRLVLKNASLFVIGMLDIPLFKLWNKVAKRSREKKKKTYKAGLKLEMYAVFPLNYKVCLS